MSEIASQASLFIPITVPSAKLPSYVSMDINSPWHVSALLSTAIETMTLPSRLKAQDSSRETLDQLVNALNVNGNQNIAKLRMSIDQKKALNGHSRPGRLEVGSQSDTRMPSQDRRANEVRDEEQEEVSTFDMEFFPAESIEQNRGRRHLKKPHVFGQAESHRVSDEATNDEATGEDEGFERARRRAAGLPIIQKSVYPFSFWKFLQRWLIFDALFLVFLQNQPTFPGAKAVCWPTFLLTGIAPAGQEHPCRSPCLTVFPTFLPQAPTYRLE